MVLSFDRSQVYYSNRASVIRIRYGPVSNEFISKMCMGEFIPKQNYR